MPARPPPVHRPPLRLSPCRASVRPAWTTRRRWGQARRPRAWLIRCRRPDGPASPVSGDGEGDARVEADHRSRLARRGEEVAVLAPDVRAAMSVVARGEMRTEVEQDPF